jgi:hypothetical protein
MFLTLSDKRESIEYKTTTKNYSMHQCIPIPQNDRFLKLKREGSNKRNLANVQRELQEREGNGVLL